MGDSASNPAALGEFLGRRSLLAQLDAETVLPASHDARMRIHPLPHLPKLNKFFPPISHWPVIFIGVWACGVEHGRTW